MDKHFDFAELKEIIPFKFRLGNGVGKYEEKGNRKIYPKYSVLGYIDSRDAQERLDELFGMNRSDEYKEIKGQLFCGVTIDGNTRWDCGTESNTEKEKGVASDSFKRACVKRGLGRFLYTLPRMYITAKEAKDNKYIISSFVQNRFYNELGKRRKSFYPKDITEESKVDDRSSFTKEDYDHVKSKLGDYTKQGVSGSALISKIEKTKKLSNQDILDIETLFMK